MTYIFTLDFIFRQFQLKSKLQKSILSMGAGNERKQSSDVMNLYMLGTTAIQDLTWSYIYFKQSSKVQSNSKT